MGSTTCKESVVRNRKATLKRKAAELSTLCDAEVCVICFDANGNLEAWPEDLDKANATIIKYNNIIQATKKTKPLSNAAAADENINLNLLDKKQILDQSKAGELDTNSHGRMWDQNLEKLSKESLFGLSNCLDAKIQTLGHKIDQFLMEEKESKADIIQLGVGPIDDEFEIIPNCCFDEFDINIHSDHITNSCNMVMVHQFDQYQLQPSIPIAPLPPFSMEFSDNATMAASQSLSNYNNIIYATWPCADYDYFPDVGNTIGIDDDGSDQYWNSLLGAVETDSDLGSELNFLSEDNKKICNRFPTQDNFGLPIWMWKPDESIWGK